jgi:hypothetical protein
MSPVSSLCHQKRYSAASLTARKMNSVHRNGVLLQSLSSLTGANSRILYANSKDRESFSMKSEDSSMTINTRTRISKWWSTISLVMDEDQNQKKVDDYLEFLDKRYHRLYNAEEKLLLPKAAKPLPVISWLIDNTQRTELADSQPMQNDALFLLGLSNLASSRLLQKHQPFAKSMTNPRLYEKVNTSISDVKSSQELSQDGGSYSSGSLWIKARSVRRDLVKFQEMQVRRFMKSMLEVVVKSPSKVAKHTKALWHYMGGKNTLALSLSMISACLFILRPATAVLIHLFFDSAFTES